MLPSEICEFTLLDRTITETSIIKINPDNVATDHASAQMAARTVVPTKVVAAHHPVRTAFDTHAGMVPPTLTDCAANQRRNASPPSRNRPISESSGGSPAISNACSSLRRRSCLSPSGSMIAWARRKPGSSSLGGLPSP